MIKMKLLFVGIILTNLSALAQPVIAPVPATVPTQAASAGYRGGNNNAGGLNVFGFQTGFNSQIWYQTNGFYRMMMNNGVGGNVDGRIAMGNSLPGTFNPLDRLHLLENKYQLLQTSISILNS